jgi:hypothetical protein
VSDDLFAQIGLTALAVAAATAGFVYGGPMGAGLAYTATMSIGGAVIANNMAPPTPEAPNESPTYAWQVADNRVRSGQSHKVLYGEEAIYPDLINQWIAVDNASGVQTLHNLYCCGIGTTNIEPGVDDITVGGQLLSGLSSDDYTLETTDGSAVQSALTNHLRLHQMRKIGKELKEAKLSQFLLHFNGDNGSTQIIDDGVGVADDPDEEGDTQRINKWVCQNTARLTTSPTPKQGTASLNLETTGDYILCDQEKAFDIWERYDWDIECQFRQDSLTNCALIGQSATLADGSEYHWGLFTHGGDIVYQQYSWDGVDHTVIFNITVPVSLSAGTWHHIRVARETDYTGSATNPQRRATIHVFVDGTLEGSESITWDYYDPDAGTYPEKPDAETWVSSIGRGIYYNGTSRQVMTGNCSFDEFRLFAYGHLYDLEDFTAPANPLADDGDVRFITKGVIDGFSVTYACPQGLFRINDDGEYTTTYVRLWIAWRKLGSTTWNRIYKQIEGNTLQPLYRQYPFTVDERGQYEISFPRLAWGNADDPKAQRTCYLQYVDEILHMALTYPYHQLLSLSLVAQDKYSGEMPAVRVVAKRTRIEVPNYTGGGTRWCYPRNNSQAAFDMLTNELYGGAKDPENILRSEWDTWNLNCYGPVNGNARCSVNMVFDRQVPLDEALQEIESAGRAEIVQRGVQYGVTVNMPTAAISGLFVPQDILGEGATVLQTNPWLSKSDSADKVSIVYIDKDQDWTEQTASAVCSDYYTMTRKAITTRISMPAINTFDEAKRLATLLVQQAESTRRASFLQTNMIGMRVTKGDVYVHVPARVRSFSGRLGYGSEGAAHYAGTTVYLDRAITLDSATFGAACTLYVQPLDGQVGTFTVTGPFDTETETVTVSANSAWHVYAPWAIVPVGAVCLYRAEHPIFNGQKHVRIEGLQYAASAYYHSNWGSDPI